jgi:phenylpropionate dioxygenase-like ring-hydroxylating dioxygenase large terminal subunit
MKNSLGETKPRSPSQPDEGRTGGKERLRPLDIHRLVDEDGRIPDSSTDAAIVKQGEVGNRKQGSWLFVAHESEIPSPGDYKALTLEQQPVIVVRGDDGRVRVLFNICRHRAVTVCREGKGNARYFECAYHGWLYNTKGHLVGVSGAEAYGQRFRKETKGLVPLPRVEMYRGAIFASLSATGETLSEYLQGQVWHLPAATGGSTATR